LEAVDINENLRRNGGEGENTEVEPGALRAADNKLVSGRRQASSGRGPDRAWMRIVKPPPVTIHGTAGGE